MSKQEPTEGYSLDQLIEELISIRGLGLHGDARVVVTSKYDSQLCDDILTITGRMDFDGDEAGPTKQLIISVGQI